MVYLVAKYAGTALIVVLVSELGRRWSIAGALLASLPLISILAMIWIHLEARDPSAIIRFSNDILWLVLPSLALFVVLPMLLERGAGFWVALASGCAATALCYAAALAARALLA
ncbi:MAG TPA: DUF3147 family protein [Pseudomonadales bacterium]|nr:DUF3147 family protein [Pseudomonadales bacterium]